MHQVSEPRAFAFDNLRIMRRLWQGVRDGDVESVHQARVATRRIRAALCVVDGVDTEDLEQFKTIGRCLGRVRELDVTQEAFTAYGTRLPQAACAVAALGRDLDTARQRALRRMVKTLDEVDLQASARRLSGSHGFMAPLKFWKDWRTDLLTQIGTRAAAVTSAMDRATAVYMPNRLHRVRIATKKLRYSLEVAGATGTSIDAHLFRDLKKAQDTLGQMRDLQTVLKRVRRSEVSNRSIGAEVRLLEAVMASECALLHKKYVLRRDQLRGITRQCQAAAGRRGLARLSRVTTRMLPAAGLVALPLAMWTCQRRLQAASLDVIPSRAGVTLGRVADM